MTWVIGGSSPFGYGVMASDVRISFEDGTEADLLRKAYRVGPYLLAGFAGSVAIGMKLIGSLQLALQIPETNTPPNVAWEPDWVVERWSPIAEKIFVGFDQSEQELGSQIVVVGPSPEQHLGNPGWPRVYVYILNAPRFQPVAFPQGLHVAHIGSGSDVTQYKDVIAEFFNITSPTLQAATSGPAAWAHLIGHNMGRAVTDAPVEGVSPHIHIQVCELGRFSEGNNDMRTHHPDGRIMEFRMPRVASNYPDFLALCAERGKAAARACA